MAALIIADVLALIGFRSESFMNNQVIRPDLQSVLYGACIYLVLLFKMKGLTNNLQRLGRYRPGPSDEHSVRFFPAAACRKNAVCRFLLKGQTGHPHFRPGAGCHCLARFSGILSLICLAAIGSLIFYSITHLGPVMLNVKGILYMAASLISIAAYVYALPAFRQGIMELKAIFSRK